jgi:hypothetical protein
MSDSAQDIAMIGTPSPAPTHRTRPGQTDRQNNSSPTFDVERRLERLAIVDLMMNKPEIHHAAEQPHAAGFAFAARLPSTHSSPGVSAGSMR